MAKLDVFPMPEVVIASGQNALIAARFEVTAEVKANKIESNAFFAGME